MKTKLSLGLNKGVGIGSVGISGGTSAAAATDWWLPSGVAAVNCIGAYQPKGAASQAASYVNLANPGTYDLTLGSAPAWDAVNGWSFTAASSHFLKTGIQMTSNNWSVVVKVSGVGDLTAALLGMRNSGNDKRFAILPNLSGTTYYQYGTGPNSLAIAGTNFTSGTLGIAGNTGWRNGTKETGTITSVAFDGTYELFIGCWNQDGSQGIFITAAIQAIAFYDVVLSDAQMAAVMAALP